MSEDEIFMTIVCGFLAAGSWIVYALRHRALRVGASVRILSLTLAAPLVSAAALWVILQQFSSADVRTSTLYTGYYLLMGAAWLAVTMPTFRLLGLDLVLDVMERRNLAAALAHGGAMLGATLCFAGANIGDGPGWWVVVFCAAMATAAWLVGWAVLESLTKLSEAVTVERDVSAGLRLAGFLVAMGLVLGRSVAGTWTTTEAAVRDFALYASPALGLVGLAMVVERFTQPAGREQQAISTVHGGIPVVLYLFFALVYLFYRGWWT